MQPSVDSSSQAEASTDARSFPISEDDVRSALERILGEEDARQVWQDACDALQIPRVSDLGPEEIKSLVDYFQQQSGTVSVVGNSLSVKIRTHKHK